MYGKTLPLDCDHSGLKIEREGLIYNNPFYLKIINPKIYDNAKIIGNLFLLFSIIFLQHDVSIIIEQNPTDASTNPKYITSPTFAYTLNNILLISISAFSIK